MRFDGVVKGQAEKCVFFEISFQATTNSVIERKSGQAEYRRRQLEEHGHRIAYVIDGGGNFARSSALSTICSNSHCTVAYGEEECDRLKDFIEEEVNA